jgi:very-short-patch-repair endonuclease
MTGPSPGTGEGGARSATAEWEGEGRRFVSLPDLIKRAKWMRAHPTEAEKRLWSLLRGGRIAGSRFRRQQIIFPYIVDFACLSARLIVEADGSQHADDPQDERRDAWLAGRGFRVLRFWNNDVLARSDHVAEAIYTALNNPHPPTAARWAPPSPVPGEGLGAPHA